MQTESMNKAIFYALSALVFLAAALVSLRSLAEFSPYY